MEVSELLKKAWTAVADAGLPDEIQPLAFQEAVRLLSPPPRAPSTSLIESSTPDAKVGNDHPSGKRSTIDATGKNRGASEQGASEQEVFDRVVQHTGADKSMLEHIVHLDDDALRLSVPGIKLGKNNADKTRAVAQILTIVRGFGFQEKETDVELIRAEVIRLKCYDPSNFFTHLSKLNGFIITGTGSNRRIRAKAGGISAFRALVESLAGVQ